MSVIIAVLGTVFITALCEVVGKWIAIITAIPFVLYVYFQIGTKGTNMYSNQPSALFDLGLDNNVEN